MQRLRVDLKTFLGLAMPNQCFHAIKKLIFGRFLGGIFGKKPQTLLIPIYIVLLYYMIRNFITTQYKGLELIWRHFWAWLCLTNAVMLSESKYLADFLVGFLGKKPKPCWSLYILPYYMMIGKFLQLNFISITNLINQEFKITMKKVYYVMI